MDIRIVLLPDKTGDKILKDYSKKLNDNFPCLFQLGKNCFSHVTLIHPQIEEKNIQKAEEILSNSAKNTNQISINFDYSKHEIKTNNYISIFLQEDLEIIDLREKLDDQLKEHILSKSKYKLPHITLTRLEKEEDLEKAFQKLHSFPKVEVLLTRIALCEVGENGTCKNILYSYPLNNPR